MKFFSGDGTKVSLRHRNECFVPAPEQKNLGSNIQINVRQKNLFVRLTCVGHPECAGVGTYILFRHRDICIRYGAGTFQMYLYQNICSCSRAGMNANVPVPAHPGCSDTGTFALVPAPEQFICSVTETIPKMTRNRADSLLFTILQSGTPPLWKLLWENNYLFVNLFMRTPFMSTELK